MDHPGRPDGGGVPRRGGEDRAAPGTRPRFERLGEVPFTSERKLMSTLQPTRGARNRARHQGCARRAARALHARACRRRGPRRSPTRAAREILATVERLADSALRTLGVAFRPLAGRSGRRRTSRSSASSSISGMVGIIDPPRDEARAAIAEAHAGRHSRRS